MIRFLVPLEDMLMTRYSANQARNVEVMQGIESLLAGLLPAIEQEFMAKASKGEKAALSLLVSQVEKSLPTPLLRTLTAYDKATSVMFQSHHSAALQHLSDMGALFNGK